MAMFYVEGLVDYSCDNCAKLEYVHVPPFSIFSSKLTGLTMLRRYLTLHAVRCPQGAIASEPAAVSHGLRGNIYISHGVDPCTAIESGERLDGDYPTAASAFLILSDHILHRTQALICSFGFKTITLMCYSCLHIGGKEGRHVVREQRGSWSGTANVG